MQELTTLEMPLLFSAFELAPPTLLSAWDCSRNYWSSHGQTNCTSSTGSELVWLSVYLHYRTKIHFLQSYDLDLLSLVLKLFVHIQVKKSQVDNYRGGQRVPHCQLRLQWKGGEQPVVLCHKLELVGAKEPFNFLTIESDPLPQGIG